MVPSSRSDLDAGGFDEGPWREPWRSPWLGGGASSPLTPGGTLVDAANPARYGANPSGEHVGRTKNRRPTGPNSLLLNSLPYQHRLSCHRAQGLIAVGRSGAGRALAWRPQRDPRMRMAPAWRTCGPTFDRSGCGSWTTSERADPQDPGTHPG